MTVVRGRNKPARSTVRRSSTRALHPHGTSANRRRARRDARVGRAGRGALGDRDRVRARGTRATSRPPADRREDVRRRQGTVRLDYDDRSIADPRPSRPPDLPSSPGSRPSRSSARPRRSTISRSRHTSPRQSQPSIDRLQPRSAAPNRARGRRRSSNGRSRTLTSGDRTRRLEVGQEAVDQVEPRSSVGGQLLAQLERDREMLSRHEAPGRHRGEAAEDQAMLERRARPSALIAERPRRRSASNA